MSVYIEMLNVVVRRSAIDAKFPGGFEAFSRARPNETLCADDHLARVGFMGGCDVEQYVTELQESGLLFLENETAVDMVVIDMLGGPTTACSWVEWGLHSEGALAAWLRGRPPGPIAFPAPWPEA